MKKHPAQKTLRISQSLMKDMFDHLSGSLCGHVLESKWVKNDYPDTPSDAIALGAYFEYLLTGALPKGGNTPQPQYMKDKGPQHGVDGMYKPYRLATENSKRVQAYFREMGLTYIQVGKRVVKGKFEGTIDILCELTRDLTFHNGPLKAPRTLKKGDKIVIDVKYSGLIGERWSRHGWPEPEQWTDEQKRYHGTQAKQYHYLTGLPYFFLVVSSSNEVDCELFEITGLDDFTMQQHLKDGEKVLQDLQLFTEIGFTPYPELKRCSECAIKERCADRQKYPSAKPVYLGLTN